MSRQTEEARKEGRKEDGTKASSGPRTRPRVRSAAKKEGKLYKSRQPHRIRGGGGDCNLGKRSQVRNGKLFRKIEFGLKCGIETCIHSYSGNLTAKEQRKCSKCPLVKHQFLGAPSYETWDFPQQKSQNKNIYVGLFLESIPMCYPRGSYDTLI